MRREPNWVAMFFGLLAIAVVFPEGFDVVALAAAVVIVIGTMLAGIRVAVREGSRR